MITNKKHSAKTIAYWQETRKRGLEKYQAKKRLIPIKERNKINQQSDQRKLLNAIYSILIKELKPGKMCEAKIKCTSNMATQVHHKRGRRNWLLIMSKYFGYHCPACHQWATELSKEAVEIGLSLPINASFEWEFTKREVELMEKYKVKFPKTYIITG